jgi:hypothetical protein
MAMDSPEERALRASIAAHAMWANTTDYSARTAKARQAALDRFERLADPEGAMDPTARARKAEHLRQAHYKRMTLASLKARRARKNKGGKDK